MNGRKLVSTAAIVLLLALIVFPSSRKLLFEKHFFKFVDSTATEYVDSGLKRATVAFATARAFNAVVSVFQESELQLEPAGLGVSLALGQALDPVNDLVERFSWVMLVALTSLGVQKVLIEITPFVSVQILLFLALLSLLGGLWLPGKISSHSRQLGKTLLVAAIFLRFAVPAMAYLNNQVYVAFLEEQHNQSVQALELSVSEMESHSLGDLQDAPDGKGENQEAKAEDGWWNRTKAIAGQAVDQGRQILDVKEKLAAVKAAANGLIDSIVKLIVVFVLSTIALPLLFLWGMLKLCRLFISQLRYSGSNEVDSLVAFLQSRRQD